MFRTVEVPLWLLVVIVLFAAVTFASHFLFPSVRWFFRRRLERAVERLNTRLERKIQPFKLARRHDMIQRLIYDPEVSKAILEHAREENVPENVAFERARRYAREIVPGFSASLYFSVGIRLAKYISRSLYRVEVVDEQAEALAGTDPEATVVFVMNHRSNMDYVLVTYLARDRSALAYAVGEWARVWPLSTLIKSVGAYFIRRRSRNALYRRVLARYVRLATDGGVAQAMYPEGGLSLTGGLQEPRIGLLKYITEGFDPEVREVVFLPVGINYDRVFEDLLLIEANRRGERKFRASIPEILWFILRHTGRWIVGRYRKFGTAAVAYGEPLTLSQFDGDAEALGEELMRRIGAAVPVVLVPLIGRILLRDGPVRQADLPSAIRAELQRLGKLGRALPPHELDRAIATAMDDVLLRRGLVTRDDGGVIRVTERGRPMLQYYANSLAHMAR